ncbi:MAG TPA: hypothetical protein VEU29_00850 [Actinomycetota bacterium]|nr:hypothetical protein [Actinomycetota bacterium]
MRPRKLLLACCSAALVAATAPPAGAVVVDKSDNVTHVANVPYTAGTDLAFSGDLVYAARQGDEGGVSIFDVSGPRPKKLGFVSCPGTQNDVAVVKPGLIALGFYSGDCGGGESGIRLIDVSNPKRPKLRDAIGFPDGTHTLTVYPGKPLIYSSPGGLGENGGVEHIVDVSNPRRMKVVGEYTPNTFGCHDLSFHFTKKAKLAFCPGQQETEILDASDPVEPKLVAEIPPNMEFPHSAVASPDGQLLVIGDESLFTVHDCTTGKSPTGALYAYDISDPAKPSFLGHHSSPRGGDPAGTPGTAVCTAHNFNFIPKTKQVVTSWYTGGTSVVDFSEPSTPVEVAHFRPDDADTWSSYWYRGRVYANDGARGLDVLKLAR